MTSILCSLSSLSFWKSAFLTLAGCQLPLLCGVLSGNAVLKGTYQLILTEVLLTDTWDIQEKLTELV